MPLPKLHRVTISCGRVVYYLRAVERAGNGGRQAQMGAAEEGIINEDL